MLRRTWLNAILLLVANTMRVASSACVCGLESSVPEANGMFYNSGEYIFGEPVYHIRPGAGFVLQGSNINDGWDLRYRPAGLVASLSSWTFRPSFGYVAFKQDLGEVDFLPPEDGSNYAGETFKIVTFAITTATTSTTPTTTGTRTTSTPTVSSTIGSSTSTVSSTTGTSTSTGTSTPETISVQRPTNSSNSSAVAKNSSGAAPRVLIKFRCNC